MSKECDVCRSLISAENRILDTAFWDVKVSTDASYPGRCFVTLKTHKAALPELSPQEWSDLKTVMQKLETATKKAFGANLCNWACLMNNAFQKKPHNPHVHWHMRPRYEKTLEIAGKKFKDNEFGYHHKTAWDVKNRPEFDAQELREVIDRYKAALQ